MDNKDVIRQFEEIELKVERVIEACKSHETTNLELINKIEGLEEELQKKTEAENKFLEERALIRSKIDSLLVRLEDITKVE
ncbi:MAG: hypothetical protein HKO79_01535 [Desulfobacterales bacterium]|nr:hypothetical protein [Deltaproteobacteria bacterium]NNK85333.1 hypothetical protein [Desulfobacterales bacterium]NNL41155.1 hypothetical protein [Desulfobacterales bacterium]